jgi:nitrilase
MTACLTPALPLRRPSFASQLVTSARHRIEHSKHRPMDPTTLRVGLAQIAPVWLDRAATLERVADTITHAAAEGCQLIAFGECLVPGYPFWIEHTDGARFDDATQKAWYAHYLKEAVCVERGDLQPLCALARQHGIAVYLGILERPLDRGGHSVYASLVYIDSKGDLASVHRKLVPTYEERLVWSPGDGHGLRVHALGEFRLGGLNCWETWMPLSRVALLAQGMNVLVSVWPGNPVNTADVTRFAAREGRCYVISVCGMLSRDDIPDHIPAVSRLRAQMPEHSARGGSCVAGPDGAFVLQPQIGSTGLYCVDLEYARIAEARHNFDPVGHYSRPDVTRLTLDRRRQSVLEVEE